MRTTPDNIQELNPNEVFVFGSNVGGKHYGGAAKLAYDKFGAKMGAGVGLYGQSVAIPTMEGMEWLRFGCLVFVLHAKCLTDKIFYVTEIGCGIAGYTPEQIAPLFKECIELKNVYLPKRFWDVLNK